MKGTCQKCGCTQDNPCREGCAWLDDDEDLCDRCAVEIVSGPVPENDLARLRLHYRAWSAINVCAIARLREELTEIRQFIFQLGGASVTGELPIEVPSGIWTPGDDL